MLNPSAITLTVHYSFTLALDLVELNPITLRDIAARTGRWTCPGMVPLSQAAGLVKVVVVKCIVEDRYDIPYSQRTEWEAGWSSFSSKLRSSFPHLRHLELEVTQDRMLKHRNRVVMLDEVVNIFAATLRMVLNERSPFENVSVRAFRGDDSRVYSEC